MEAQRQGDFTNNFSIYTYTHQNIYWGRVSVFDKYLHWPCVSVKNTIYIYIYIEDKCKSKLFTLDLHVVYIAIDTYTHNNI